MDHEVTEDQTGTGRAGCRDDASLIDELRNAGRFHDPQRITGAGGVMVSGCRALAMRAGHKIQRSIVFGHIIKENVQVECTRLGHAVICMVGRKIIVPLPKITDKSRFDVDLDLLHVKRRSGDLLRGPEQTGMTGESLKHRVALM